MDSTHFAQRLLTWYDHHGRKDLPWQHPTDPYRTWVSEIMLQQTQVATVIPYFQAFIARFPDIASLAAAPLDDVLHHWSGLGYYSRARNLHQSARIVCQQHHGHLPRDFGQLLALPGIGRSTAGAILSLACGQRHPILDGNVKRVLARHRAISGWPGQSQVVKQLWQLAEQLTPQQRCGDYNQAMMDLGATLCRRRQPDCGRCPVNSDCQARRLGRQHHYPGPKPRKKLPQRETRLLLVRNAQGAILLQRRPPTGIWGGLWSPPELPPGENPGAWAREHLALELGPQRALAPIDHVFSHFRLKIHPILAELDNTPATCVMEENGTVWYKAGRNDSRGLAAPVQRLLNSLAKQQEQIQQ